VDTRKITDRLFGVNVGVTGKNYLIRLAIPKIPITLRAPSREGHPATLSFEFNH
jgi:hypothetical protein